jgi:hypothetical protein
MGFDAHLEPDLGKCIVGFCDVRLLLPLHHFGLVEYVGVIHLLQIELEFALVRYGDVGAN